MCILNFHLVPNVPKFSKYHDYCVSTTHILFSDVTLFYVTVPNFFPIYCYFMSTIAPPQQTGAVKTLPLHTPISLVLSFFFLPMNSQFNFFVLTEFLFSSNNANSICMPYSSLCCCLSPFIPVHIFSANTTTIPRTGTHPLQTSSII